MNQLSAMEFVTTTRGARSLLHEGYKYTLNQRTADGHTYWRCHDRSCPGSCLLLLSFVIVLVCHVVIVLVCHVVIVLVCHVVIVLVCHVVTKIVLDEMGHLLTSLDKMGLDEMGLDEMG